MNAEMNAPKQHWEANNMADDVERLRGMSDEVLQKVSNAFDFGETLNTASMRQIVEILADELEVVVLQPDCNGDFEGDVWFGHPEKRTLGTHIWRAGAWHELPSELDAVISLLGQARSQRDANADLIATLRADLAKAVEGLEGALGGLGCRSDCEWLHPDGSKCDCGNRERKLIAQSLIKELRP